MIAFISILDLSTQAAILEKQAYGLLAEVLVGSLIMGEKLRIINEENSISLDNNGISIKDSSQDLVFFASTSGNVYVQGDIYATSLTLADGVTIQYAAIADAPDMDKYVTIKDGCMQTNNYKYVDGEYSVSGMKIDFSNQYIRTQNFSIDSSGYLYAKGGIVGGFNIGDYSLYNGTNRFDDTTNDGIYIGTDGINIGAGSFTVTKDGSVNIQKGVINIGDTDGEYPSYTKINQEGFSYVSLSTDESLPWEMSIRVNSQGIILKDYFPEFGQDTLMFFGQIGDSSGSTLTAENYIYGYPRLSIMALDEQYLGSSFYTASINMSTSSRQQTSTIDMYAYKIDLSAFTSGKLRGTWYGTSDQAIASDNKLKNSIENLSEKYSCLFDELTPVRYKYNDGTSNRYHTGFIAQQVKTAIENSGLKTNDTALYIEATEYDKDEKENTTCYLRYGEFIALCVNEIQKLKSRLAILEKSIQE